ncbi:hypothetical protein PSHT_04473 [Puccinia striiformis]|uniref:Uncharacterized protein n=1 Tax=Puccinia striiformis TaxID=27350 RepID=A0A2S4WD06_9BASI|nr:hypothetical protein PSHT_04473 [Puccinia striiformis]
MVSRFPLLSLALVLQSGVNRTIQILNLSSRLGIFTNPGSTPEPPTQPTKHVLYHPKSGSDHALHRANRSNRIAIRFDLQNSTTNQSASSTANCPSNIDQAQQNPNAWKGKANLAQAADKHCREASKEEAVIEQTRKDLEQKISELNQLKNQLAETEQRERELASRITT